MILALLTLSAFAQVPEGAPTTMAATVLLNVRAAPSDTAQALGRLAPGSPVRVREIVEGPGCAEGWAALEPEGYACSHWMLPAEGVPGPVPTLIAFDPPEPDEYEAYRDSGTYDRAPVATAIPLLPFIYGKRWRHWEGHIYASAEHFAHGDAPVGQLDRNSKHAFIEAQDTPRGQVLLQEDGSVVPANEVYLDPVDRFVGRELALDPAEDGTVPAWVFRYEGAQIRVAPDPKAEIAQTLPYHQALEVDPTPASPDGQWWRLPDALGEGVDGFVDEHEDIRHWEDAPLPEGLAPDEAWLDIDLSQQLAAWRVGAAVRYLTMISSGVRGRHQTPAGLYHLMDKTAWGDMASLEGAVESYFVERVPWVIHFRPRYALHGVFWHWGFGHPASHGCINLAPRDAAWLYPRLAPAAPDGWHTVYARPDRPGSLVRIRG